MSSVEVYAVGPVSLSACMPKELPIDDALDEINAQHPTGITSPWMIATEEAFSSGEPNPCPCEQTPDRVHRLFHC